MIYDPTSQNYIFAGGLTVEFVLEIILEIFFEIVWEVPSNRDLPMAVRIICGVFSALLIIAVIALLVMCSVIAISANLLAGLLITALLIFLVGMIIFSAVKKFKSR